MAYIGSMPRRLADARILMWYLVIVFATGIPLMVWFREDVVAHAAGLPDIGTWVRTFHAASSVLLTLGAVGHLVVRLIRPASLPKGLRTGAWAFLCVAVAGLTGAMIAQTAGAQRLLELMGLGGLKTAVTWTAVAHIAYTTLLVLVTVYLHVAKWGWRRIFGGRLLALVAVASTAAVALLAGPTSPGDTIVWSGLTWILAPPLPFLWAWTLVLGTIVVLIGPRLHRQVEEPSTH